MKNIIDTRTIIINLLEEDKKFTLNLRRLQKLICFIYDNLSREKLLNNYDILFDINFDSIRRTVLYNNNLFELDFAGNEIRLKKLKIDDLVKQYPVDSRIKKFINEFKETYAG